MPYVEFDMREAYKAVHGGARIRKTARKFQVPYSTLRDRLHGVLPHSVAHQDFQKLSVDQEDKLAEWVLFQGELGDPPTHTEIRELAKRVSAERGDGVHMGRAWMKQFLNRHPVLKTHRPQRIDMARVRYATPAVIQP